MVEFKGDFIKHFLFICSLHVMLMASVIPLSYTKLAQELVIKEKNVEILKNSPHFMHASELNSFHQCLETAFEIGFEWDKHDDIELKRSYLKELRRCSDLYEKIEYLQSKAIRKSIKEDNYEGLIKLLEAGMAENSSLEEEVLAYYEKKRKIKTITFAEEMLENARIDQESRKRYEEEYAAYEEHIAVVARKEAQRIRKMTAPSKRRNVLVSTEQNGEGYDFIAENFNSFRVTVTLELKKTHNIVSSKKLPYYFELPPKSAKKVLHVSKISSHESMSFQSNFSWIMGSASAQHSNVAYQIPFAKGARIPVSQGFNGTTSHKGKHAIDFAVPTGTPIHAARGGKVVALEASNHLGKFDKSYSKYANYLVIEHDDKTLGKYYHLKHNGVAVKRGTKVKQGELIAYSGNTGYTSGPHLHFSVSKVDPKTMNRPQTIAIRFKNSGHIIKTPKKGDVITVQ
ncbi:MAG: M23 family metallopeptidase [Campylobacterota bacterium]|nr:M23 family metallopeptidase [Campylobacterota bacterium]